MCETKASEVMIAKCIVKKIHAAGMFGGMGKRKTYCGIYVDDDQLPIIGTDREINCQRCLGGRAWREHKLRWAPRDAMPKEVPPHLRELHDELQGVLANRKPAKRKRGK